MHPSIQNRASFAHARPSPTIHLPYPYFIFVPLIIDQSSCRFSTSFFITILHCLFLNRSQKVLFMLSQLHPTLAAYSITFSPQSGLHEGMLNSCVRFQVLALLVIISACLLFPGFIHISHPVQIISNTCLESANDTRLNENPHLLCDNNM